jgi:hypothetical protein
LKLYFRNFVGIEKLIAEPSSIKEVINGMDKFIKEHNFKSRYKRLWQEGDRVICDFGSWSEFFTVEGLTFDDFHEYEIKQREKRKKREEKKRGKEV